MRRSRRNGKRVISDLNLTNLIDVVFSLLIIFMITAPMMTSGIDVNLPDAESKNIDVEKPVNVTINSRQEIFIDERMVAIENFRITFHESPAVFNHVPVFINADKSAPYGLVIRVIADIQKEGVKKLNFLTNQL